MPTTRRESFQFGVMMCFGMVVVMSVYNLTINGLIGVVSLQAVLIQLMLSLVFAFLAEWFIVGPLARKITFSLPFTKVKKVYMILTMSVCIVTGMVLVMSFYGLVTSIMANTLGEQPLLYRYFSIVFKNLIFALPLQLLVMGPLVRFVFIKFVKTTSVQQPV
ncbi:hypothetical protein HXA35_06365 [Bacillus sp. A301a_S52]|nr:hypothetical protein [Bacillus sp. A301a_S52]